MLKVRLPIVDSLNDGTTRRLVLAKRCVRWPGRSARLLRRVVVVVVENEHYLGGIIALQLQDYRTISIKSVCSNQYMVTDQH